MRIGIPTEVKTLEGRVGLIPAACAELVWEGVVHFGVTNMPGAVPRSASQVLSAALIPYAIKLTQRIWERDPALAAGINVRGGEVVYPTLKALA